MKARTEFGNNKGFTLIEMAIVLVIIGLILGAVIKGKDLIQGAKQKRFYSKAIKGWELSVLSYFDRTGNLLADGTSNGGSAAAVNGQFDNISGANFGNANGVDAALKKVGLTVPSSNTSNSGQFTYKGVYSGTRTITFYLYWLHSHTDNINNNAIYLTNIPTDLAIGLDTIVDGSVGAGTGAFRRYHDNADGGTWPDASTTPVVNAFLIVDVP